MVLSKTRKSGKNKKQQNQIDFAIEVKIVPNNRKQRAEKALKPKSAKKTTCGFGGCLWRPPFEVA